MIEDEIDNKTDQILVNPTDEQKLKVLLHLIKQDTDEVWNNTIQGDVNLWFSIRDMVVGGKI